MKLLLKSLKEEKSYLVKLQASRAGVNQATLGFLDACEELCEQRIHALTIKKRLLGPRKEGDGLLTTMDIYLAKQVPISTFLKVPSHKKVQCLFHSDTKPSMHIYGTNYHCYTCNAHGSIIDVVMKLRNCSFTSAVRYLIGK